MSDVVIVGGGPAGSATALHLARAGIDVTLIERSHFPRRKVCGEYLNCGAVAALDALGLRDRTRAVSSPLRGIRLIATGAAPVELPFAEPALACERATLDDLLLTAASEAGVTVIRGRVEALTQAETGVTGVTYRDTAGEAHTLRAQCVVGADGAGSTVARKLGLTLPLPGGHRRFAIGGHYRGFGDLGGCVEMYVGGGAYFALNPLDAERANVMVVVPNAALERWSADVDRGVRGEAAKLAGGRRSFVDAERIGERVSVGPLVHRVRAPIAAGALLVGDAAGLLNPFTGQGVFLALLGAQAASTALMRALHDRSAQRAAFHAYAATRRSDFRARSLLGACVTLLVDVAPLARRAVTRLERHARTRRVLIDALSGLSAPQTGFAPGVLASLLA